MSRLSANAILLLTAFIWGCAFVAQATAMRKLGPVAFTGLRFLIAAGTILPFAAREGRGRILPRRTPAAPGKSRVPENSWVRSVLVLSVVFLGGQILQQFGIMATSVTNAEFLAALYVILVPIFGVLLFRRWPHPTVWGAALAALAGTWLLSGGVRGFREGDLLVMGSAVFWALQVLLIGRVVEMTGRPLFAAFAQSLCAGIVTMAAALALEPPSLSQVAAATPELLFAGVLSGGLAFSLQAIGQRHTGAVDAAIIFSAEAVFAALAAAVLLGERITALGALGCALILAAILAAQLAPNTDGVESRS
jgi:drug/metabolite transporter (DMT)-like permease